MTRTDFKGNALLVGARLVLPGGVLEGEPVLVEGGRIARFGGGT